MLLPLSPISLLFFCTYILLSASFLLFTDNFFVLWLLMELHIIMFMVISIPCIISYSSSLITFFLVQSVSSLMILIGGLTLDYTILFVSFLINLGAFPFFSWFISSVSLFPNLPLLLSLTIQNIPTLLVVYIFIDLLSCQLLLYLSLFLLIGPISSVNSSHSLNILLIWSSSITSIWFIMSLFVSLYFFIFFWFTYSVVLYLLINSTNIMFIYFLAITISGFPPFPVFFMNLLIIYSLSLTTISWLIIFLVLLFSVSSIYLYTSFITNKLLLSHSKLYII